MRELPDGHNLPSEHYPEITATASVSDDEPCVIWRSKTAWVSADELINLGDMQ